MLGLGLGCSAASCNFNTVGPAKHYMKAQATVMSMDFCVVLLS